MPGDRFSTRRANPAGRKQDVISPRPLVRRRANAVALSATRSASTHSPELFSARLCTDLRANNVPKGTWGGHVNRLVSERQKAAATLSRIVSGAFTRCDMLCQRHAFAGLTEVP